jgi:hypothetical protein
MKTTTLNDRIVSADEDGQPLVCYGCAHSAAFIRDTSGEPVKETVFPGRSAGERPCCFCIRNPDLEKQIQRAKDDGMFQPDGPYGGRWFDGDVAIKVPMDCYHSLDMKKQFQAWLAKAKAD